MSTQVFVQNILFPIWLLNQENMEDNSFFSDTFAVLCSIASSQDVHKMPSLDSETQFRWHQGPSDSLGKVTVKLPLGYSCKRVDIDFSPLGM